MDRTVGRRAAHRITRRERLFAASVLGLSVATLGAGAAKAAPGRIYCFTPAANVFEYKGVTNEPTETTLLNPNGSFSDGQDWNGAYAKLDTNTGVCLDKLPPGPSDNLFVGPVSNGTTFVSTTIGGGGGAYQSLFVTGAPPSTHVTLTLDTNGSPFAGSVTAQQGQATFQGGLSAGTAINLTNVDLQNPAQYTLQGGSYSAGSEISVIGATVTAPSSATLKSPQVHDDGDIELGGKLAASSFLTVGEFGFGRLNIQSSAAVTSGEGFIGAFAGSNGSVIVNGKWTLTGELIDGQLGHGALTVGAGGQITTGDFMAVGAGAGLSTLDITGGGNVFATPKSGLPTDLALNTAVDPRSIAMVSVTGASSVFNINGALDLGYAGTATMNVTTGATVNIEGSIVRIGRLAGSNGTLNLTGAGSRFALIGPPGFGIVPSTLFQVGTAGTGAMNVTGGFQLATGDAAVTLGAEAGGKGTVLVSDAGTKWTIGSTGSLVVGLDGHGSLTVSNGGSLEVDKGAFFDLGADASGIGDLTLSGAASSLQIEPTTTFHIGDGGHGNLVLNQGFSLDMSGSDANVFLGSQSTGVGFVSMTGFGTSWEIGGSLVVGGDGKGEMDVTGGASLTLGNQVAVGQSAKGGKLVLSGSGSSLTLEHGTTFVVGDGTDGIGTLDVTQGFHLDTGSTSVILGVHGEANGAVVLSDPGTTWTVGGELDVGLGGSGGIKIENGATLTIESVGSLELGVQPEGVGVVELDGASSKLAASSATVLIGVQGVGELDIQNSATLDWSSQSVVLGAQDGSSGTIGVLSGGTFNVKNLTLGQLGSGELDVGAPGVKATLNVLGITLLAAGDPANDGFHDNNSGSGTIMIDGGSQATFGRNVVVGEAIGDANLTLDNASSALMKRDLDVGVDSSPDSEVTLLHGSDLTVQGLLTLGSVGATTKLSVENSSSVEAQGGFAMGGSAELSLADGGTFNSTAASAVTIGGTNSLGTAKVSVTGGSHLTLTGGIQIIPEKSTFIEVTGAGSTLTADFMTSQSGSAVMDVDGGAQVTFSAGACKCEALTFPGLITLNAGSVLSAPTATLGSDFASGLIAINGGSAAFSQYLKLMPGSMLDVSGGGDVVVGAPSSLGAGQIVVGAGGILKGIAGATPATISGDLIVIKNKGQLTGTLNINGKVVVSGTHLLGDDPSTVTVNGSYTLGSTGVIIAEVGPTSYSKLIVNGPMVLDGGTLEFEPVLGGMFKINATYNVLTVSGGVTGSFADVTVAQPAGMPFIQLSSDFVDGTLEVTATHMPGSFASVATTANQHAVAATLDRAAPTATGALGDFINVLSNSNAATVGADFDPLSGEAYGAFAQAGMQANRDFAAALRGAAAQTSGRQSALTAFDAPRQSLAVGGGGGDPSIWMNTVGGFDREDGVDGSHGVRTTAGGLAGGVDLSPASHWALGAAFGYLHSDLSVGSEGSGTLATYQGALYAGYAGERLYVDAAAGYAQSNGSLQRSLAPAALISADGQVRADQYFASGEAGIDLGRWNGAVTTPFVALDAVNYHQAALTEDGAAGLGLAVDGRTTDSVRSELGLQLSTAQHASDSPFEASFRLGWGHEFADGARPVTSAFIGAPELPFTVRGAPAARDFAVIGFGLGARLHSGVTFSARYDANLSSRTSEQLLSLNARFAW